MKKVKEHMKKMTIKKQICFFVVFVILAAVLFFTATNIKSLQYDSSKFNISDSNIVVDGFSKDGNKYVSKKSKSSIKIKLSKKKYIKKIIFKYKAKNNFGTTITFDEVTKNSFNSSLTNLFVEKINRKTDTIKLVFDQPVSIENIRADNSLSFNIRLFLAIIIPILSVLVVIFNINYFSKNVHKLFLVIAIPVGLTIIFASAPILGAGGDDDYHFGMTYQLLKIHNRHSWNENAYLSRNGYVNFLMFNTEEEISDGIKVIDKLNDQKVPDQYYSVRFQSLTYIPSSFVLNTALLIGIPFSISIILAKIINLLMYVIVMYFAIKYVPKFKYLFAFIGLIPTSLYVACQFSYDSKVTAFFLLMMAFILKEMINKDEKMSKLSMAVIILSAIVGASTKGIYIVLLVPALFISKDKFKSKKECYIFRALVVLAILFVISTFLGPSLQGGDTRLNSTASVQGQIANIIHQPTTLVRAYYNSAFKLFFIKFFGSETLNTMGYYGITASNNAIYLTLILLIFVTIYECSDVELNKKYKLILLIVTGLLTCFIWGALYLSYTAVGATHIDGVQGRYFVPLIIPLLACLASKKKYCNIDSKKVSIAFSTIICFILMASLVLNIVIPFAI